MLLTGEEQGNHLVLVTWVYYLKKIDGNGTRLMVRWRSDPGGGYSPGPSIT